MPDHGFFSDLPRWQRPFAWVLTIAATIGVMGLVVLLILGGLAAAFGWGREPAATNVAPVVSTTTSSASLVTTDPVPISTSTTDPTTGRPVYTEFSLIALYDTEVRATCAEKYNNDIGACYDGYEGGTEDFEAKVTEAYRSFVEAATRPGRYSSEQYGCHDDSRCLDDYDEWCWESEVQYIEGFGVACPGTAEAINDQLEEDFYRDQMESERYPDP
ncbi:MAG: hypothetical protein WD895_05315 [Acidimicrobiia bacterium]